MNLGPQAKPMKVATRLTLAAVQPDRGRPHYALAVPRIDRDSKKCFAGKIG